MESLEGDVTRLTSLLERAIRTRFVEAPVTPTVVTPYPTTMTSFQ